MPVLTEMAGTGNIIAVSLNTMLCFPTNFEL